MAKRTCITDGMEELNNQLSSLGNAAQGAASRGLFRAAGIYVEWIGKGINGITVRPYKYANRKKGEIREPSPEERAMLQGKGSIGIAKFHKTGVSVDTSVGFNGSGYAEVTWQTKRHKGRTTYKHDGEGTIESARSGAAGRDAKPVLVIANAINSGTSFMKKQPFFRRAVSQAKKPAEDAFDADVEETLNALQRGD